MRSSFKEWLGRWENSQEILISFKILCCDHLVCWERQTSTTFFFSIFLSLYGHAETWTMNSKQCTSKHRASSVEARTCCSKLLLGFQLENRRTTLGSNSNNQWPLEQGSNTQSTYWPLSYSKEKFEYKIPYHEDFCSQVLTLLSAGFVIFLMLE